MQCGSASACAVATLLLLAGILYAHAPRRSGWVPVTGVQWTREYQNGSTLQEDGLCGNWQHSYAQLHGRILRGDAPPRFAVARGLAASGLADTLTGSVTVAIFALLTGRAFQVHHPEMRFELGYGQPSINWSYSPQLDGGTARRWTLTPVKQKHWPRNITPEEQRAIDFDITDAFKSGDLTQIGANYSHVEFSTHYGMSVALFNNPFVGPQLRELGLTPWNAFGCIFGFLFEPKPALLQEYEQELRILQDTSVLKIGVHIRVGDSVFTGKNRKPGNVHMRQARKFFDCAKQIEASYAAAQPKSQTVWFLVSDAVALRQSAAEAYPGKVISPVNVSVQHVLGTYGGGGAAAVQAAITEHWLLGMTDYQIVGARSGYGRTAAFLAFSRNRNASSAYVMKERSPEEVACGPADFADFRKMARTMAGV